MELKKIRLGNFRNYKKLELELNSGANIFLGVNGAGKTNLIEALEIVSTCRSHRTRNDGDIININADSATVEVEYERYGARQRTSVTLIKRRPRIIKLGENKITLSELIGNIKTVLFSPYDLMLAKGSPSVRRSFLDREICQADRVYLKRLMRYNTVLKERNALLKQIKEGSGNKNMLEVYDIQFAKEASFIVLKRLEILKELSKVSSEIVNELSDKRENLEIIYEQGQNEITSETDFLKLLEDSYIKDIKRGFTGVGPHVDDLLFKMNGKSLKSYASQGQQRTAALAAKLSEVSLLKERTEEYPILLLDDVLSELDEKRRKKLLDFVVDKGVAAFLTATDSSYIPKNIGVRYMVKDGEVFRN